MLLLVSFLIVLGILANEPFAVNSGASANLSAAISAADGSYNPSMAITFMASEARNENIL
jgi:hypothetical protein